MKQDSEGGPWTGATAVTVCRACRAGRLETVLDLGEQPACDRFPMVEDAGPDPRWPLALGLCAACGLVQLTHTSPTPEPPRAIESSTMLAHARTMGRRIAERTGIPAGSSVFEFSSHHGGSWIDSLAANGFSVVDHGPADLVVDNHSIIHEEDTDNAFAERVGMLARGGWFAVEFHHALAQVTEGQFDTVRHGHPVYLSLAALDRLARRHGLLVVDAWPEPVYGGCLVALMRCAADVPDLEPGVAGSGVTTVLEQEMAARLGETRGYVGFARQAQRACTDLRAHLEQARDRGLRVIAYGAGSKACTLLAVAGIDLDLLGAVADLSAEKHGRRLPGTSIPIISPSELVARRPDEVLVLTWDIAPEVISQLQGMGLSGADFVVPMPTIRRV